MYQAIATKFLGPTNHHGARIKASAEAGSVTVPWDHSLSTEQNHVAAAKAFAAKWEWTGAWAGGALPDGRGFAFVRLPTGMHFVDAGERLGFTLP